MRGCARRPHTRQHGGGADRARRRGWSRVRPPPPAGESDADLAKKLANPVANLISVPFQNNWDCCTGPEGGGRYTLNIQPVMPFSLGDHANVIVRTILPVIDQQETVRGQGDHFGLGDITQSFFFTPKSTVGGLVIAAGPVFLWPVGDSHFSGGEWAAGPTFLVLKQQGHWTYGLLANHLWSYAGPHDHEPISTTFLQPFVSYTFPDTTSLTLNAETSYDWVHGQWTAPINISVAHLFKIAGQRVQLGAGAKIYADSPDGPQAGARLTATLLFPK